MIIIDTHIISETQKPEPDSAVMDWLNNLDRTTTYITAITVGELLFGIDKMPKGKRQEQLNDAITAIVEQDFYGRILPYDATAAYFYAAAAGAAMRRGLSVSFADGAIAGIARANNLATVATRDEAPFRAMGVTVINPWDPAF
ncbi:type II toxin-antitoxin system VapC family toxin [Phyllobacterium salinisoli]|uniref:Ribonuclease VapC n=1 Tax=Phyllobacterium salinisoli TaxID=1899321 RepID=A0A368JZN4_9HYPH|nr:type II toxin-antitoxin system VapC family toxin [Phyllobacterium salinisoli]RCS21663.1 type II toxin-antitoxin system VapC family toxin [Phyllobacterium salinisoli]